MAIMAVSRLVLEQCCSLATAIASVLHTLSLCAIPSTAAIFPEKNLNSFCCPTRKGWTQRRVTISKEADQLSLPLRSG